MNFKFLWALHKNIRVPLVLFGCVMLAAWTNGPSAKNSPSGQTALSHHLGSGSSPQLKFNSSYGNLPMAFEANEGQTDSKVRYMVRGGGYILFLTDQETVIAFSRYDNSLSTRADLAKGKRGHKLLGRDVLRLRLTGSNRGVSFEAQNLLPGISNYFIGKDPGQWQTNVKQYSQVTAHEVYPGIDMVYYGKQGSMEYDFHVKPGADPKAIRIQHMGADSATVDDQGNLQLAIGDKGVRFKPPTVYQEDEGVTTIVSGKYVTTGTNEIGFEIGDYDKTKTLVIDPALDYSTYFGGNGQDDGYGIAADAGGNAYVTGETYSSNFPTTSGAFQTTNASPSIGSAFVTKINAAGSALIYSTYLGGSNGSEGFGIAVNTNGDAYVTGQSDGNFPTTAGAYQTTFSGTRDAFVTQLNAAGNGLIYSTYLGGNLFNEGYGIGIDSSGIAYITGYTDSSNFPTTSGAYQTTYAGGGAAFMTKLNSAGSALDYSTYLGGSKVDEGYAIAVDSSGNAYITGNTNGNFPTTAGAFQTVYGGGSDNVFVAKVNPAGAGTSDLVYSTYLGGSTSDSGYGIAVDPSENAYVTGETSSTNFPTTSGAYQTTYGGGGDAFVTKLNPSGGALVYSTYLGGSGTEEGYGVVLDSSEDAYVVGYSSSTNFPTTAGAYQTTLIGSTNAFLTMLNAAGNAPGYSTYLGGTADDYGYGVALDTSGDAYLTGVSYSTNFPTTLGAFQTTYDISGDGFITKFDVSDFYTPTPTNSPTVTSTVTATNTPTMTPTNMPTNTITNTATYTSTSTVTNTPTVTATSTITNTPTVTSTANTNCCQGLSSMTGFSEPSGMAIDYSRSLIYMADRGDATLYVFTTAGVPVTHFSTWTGGAFDSPSDVTLDNLGNVYVADYNGEAVYEFANTTYSYMGAIASGMVSYARGVWMDTTQGATLSLYITSQNGNVYRYDSVSGGAFNAAVTFGGAAVLNVPTGIIKVGSEIYVVADADKLVEFGVPGYAPTTLYTGASDLKFIKTDLAGNFYVTEASANKLDEFLSGLGSPPSQCPIPNNPRGVVVDPTGKIFVSEDSGASVTVLQGCVTEPTLTPTNIPTSTSTVTPTNSATSTATNSPTNTATNTPTSTPTTTVTNTPTMTSTDTPTNTATSTPTDTATNTPTDTATNTATITSTSTPTNSATNTATLTVTSTATNTATLTATSTPTNSATVTSTNTPTNSATNTGTCTPTSTATQTPTITDTQTATNSATVTSTITATNSSTLTATVTSTFTATNSATATATHTATNSATNTATVTDTLTATNSPTITDTSTATHTPTLTSTVTATNSATNSATVTKTSTVTRTPTLTPTSTITSTPTATPVVTLITISAPYPNPVYSSGPVSFDVTVPSPSTVSWDVFTLAFRKIYGSGSQGIAYKATYSWDLKDKDNKPVANGVYYIRVTVVNMDVGLSKVLKVLVLH